MQINNQVNLNKLSLNISSTSESGLKFKEGEILKGQVLEIKEGGLISINLKGQIIDALTRVEVIKGQDLLLIVDQIKDGKSILKVVDPHPVKKMETSNISNTLKGMNLPSNDKNLQLANKLIKHNLPVTFENIKTLSKGLNLLNSFSPKNLEIVGLAMAKGAPLTQETLEALVQFVDGKSNLASLTKETLSLISQMEGMGSSQSNEGIKLLKQLVETISLPTNKSPAEDMASEVSQAIKTNVANENDLLRGLVLAKDILSQKEMPGKLKNLTDLLLDKVDIIGKELGGQKIPNVMSRFFADSNLNSYYLSFPVKFEDQYRLSQMRISKNPGSQSLRDMDKIKLAVSLDTSKLGLVLFHVEWHKNSSLKIEGLVENEIALKHIEGNLGKLISDLESQKYVVDFNGIKVSTDGKEGMRLKLEEKSEVVRPLEIDIWV